MRTNPFKVGDRVMSTFSLGNDPFAGPKVVSAVHSNLTVEADNKFYHADELLLIQRPNPEAKAKRASVGVEPVPCGRHLGEDCAIALDELLQGGEVTAEDLPSWLIATAALVIDVL